MKKIVIIGAGAMGSAFAVPCADNGHETFLVGSFLEDKVIDLINKKNNFHPVLNCQLPKNTISTIEENGNKFLRFQLKNMQKGGCSKVINNINNIKWIF